MFTLDNNRVNQMIKDIAYKHGLTAEQGYDIMRHQFEFVRQVMDQTKKCESKTHKDVNLMYIGVFSVKNRFKLTALNDEQFI